MIFGEGGVILRPIEEKDLNIIRRYNMMYKDDLLRRWPITDYEHFKWFKKPPKDSIHFSVCTDDEIVGIIGLRNINWIDRNGDLIILIWEPKKGYGKMAVKAISGYAFKDLGLHKIYLRVLESNQIAINCYTKCGFKVEGILDDEVYTQGRFQNIVRMGLINE